MKFNNRPNECVTTTDGRKFFISRSPAVIPQIYALVQNPEPQLYVLVNRRGPECPDHVGKWALPCGYLDWDESANQAARREIHEECDFDIFEPNTEKWDLIYPLRLWNLITDPSEDARQNILIHLTQAFVMESLPEVTKIPDKETSEVLWMPVEQALRTEFAFGHQYNIYECMLKTITDRSPPWPGANIGAHLAFIDLSIELTNNTPQEVKKTASQKVATRK